MNFRITAANRWPVAIVAVLISQVIFGIWMAKVAGNDPHFAIEPNYYARAVDWDATMAQSRRDKALGWRATATLTRGTLGSGTLQLSLIDSSGGAVRADSVTVQALAVAHASQVDSLTLRAVPNGYAAPVPHVTAGLWELRVRAVHGADVFTAKLRTDVP